MRMRRKEVTGDVAPAYNTIFYGSDDMGVALLEHVEDEFAGLWKRKGLQHRQILPLSRHDIERLMEALYVIGARRRHRDLTHSAWLVGAHFASHHTFQLCTLKLVTWN
ncbi:hypothetical protein SF83666_d70120 (plasmid) [Sinorhizobium fredii CCBAU 83666]|nr:hypothetical protein SF83666_d70120 [Sinorhizobium fredii CCBAU 83666]